MNETSASMSPEDFIAALLLRVTDTELPEFKDWATDNFESCVWNRGPDDVVNQWHDHKYRRLPEGL